ncbi:GMC family oxidoreductase [Thalassotalea sp. PLHSN55]|uniref:GMC family oxidoreductase n=1 Tax=Thalassotalea sp. PLHSN55 TaxID=3435888 RepID=UPI003F85276C
MFDYIIIGGGSAGCLLANRLSADANNKVCLIEAGRSDRNYLVRTTSPINMIFLMHSPLFNWLNYTDKQVNSGYRELFWPRGKGLGGSSSINAMIYTRGHRWDYDHWASLGNNGWDYDSVLPIFKQTEKNQRGADEFHGANGEMSVVDTNFRFAPSEAFVDACIEANFPLNNDMNGAEQEGCGFFQITQTPEGVRCNASLAFLDPILTRPNLTILTQSTVKRIVFDGKTATGVEYYDAKKTLHSVSATKEIILAAGVLNSPQILKLSGVGPAQELKKHNIDVIHDLPGVGENLQDHPDIIIRCLESSSTSFKTLPTKVMLDFVLKRFSKKKPMVFSPTDCGGFIKSSPELDIPDLQLQFAALRMKPHGEGLFTPARNGFVLHICYLRPESRGRVLLATNSPFDNVKIQANYFDQEKELDALVKGVKIGREILAQPALASLYKQEEKPGADIQTDEQIKQYLRDNVETVYHTAGSCKMGNDDMAVVDSELKVHGLNKLRVIDSSIMPTITGSNIHGPTVMIAEKGAKMILDDWQ